MYRIIRKYFEKHAYYNSVMHLIFGVGLGILIARPVIGEHPVRWAMALMAIGTLGHLYPLTTKK